MFADRPQWGVFFSFCIYSFAFGALFPRLGDIQLAMGISQGILGLSIIGIALGLQVSLLVAGRLLDQLGFKAVMIWGIPFISLTEMLASTATSPVIFFSWLFLTGLSLGLVEVAVNVEADRVERVLAKRIMNRSHAFWSLGFALAGLTGALIAQLAVAVTLHLFGLFLFSGLLSVIVFRRYKPAARRAGDDEDTVLFARPTKPVLGLVALSISAMLLEGAGIDWSVIFMRDMFNTAPFISGLALTLFATSQFVTRYIADRYVERYGPQLIAKLSLIVLAAGVLAIALSPNAMVALLGFALIGIGTAVIFPLAISAAAQLTDRPSAVNVASFAQLSFVVFLLAPPILGNIADYFGIRVSFAIGLPLVILSFLSLKSLRAR